MSTLTKLFPQFASVEEIHAEIDSAQDRLIDQTDSLLKELNIVTETQIERKVGLLKQHGFVNSELVVKSKGIEKNRYIFYITKKIADLLQIYKTEYPMEKFLTIEEFERICDKYKLIYAPVYSYIKDVPEKNLLELSKAKKLLSHLKPEDTIKFVMNTNQKINGLTFEEKYLVTTKGIYISPFFRNDKNSAILKTYFKCDVKCENEYVCRSFFDIKRDGLFIAAPKSHFDLTDLKQYGKNGFLKMDIIKQKDPIVFEFCKGDMVRILTKWGTKDDQSFLDPLLVNEKLN